MRHWFVTSVSLLALTAAATSPADAGPFIDTGGMQTEAVTQTGRYHIVVEGAEGGHGANGQTNGGAGVALMGGDIVLTAGDVLDIVVGGQGTSVGGIGGGGGSFLAAGIYDRLAPSATRTGNGYGLVEYRGPTSVPEPGTAGIVAAPVASLGPARHPRG